MTPTSIYSLNNSSHQQDQHFASYLSRAQETVLSRSMRLLNVDLEFCEQCGCFGNWEAFEGAGWTCFCVRFVRACNFVRLGLALRWLGNCFEWRFWEIGSPTPPRCWLGLLVLGRRFVYLYFEAGPSGSWIVPLIWLETVEETQNLCCQSAASPKMQISSILAEPPAYSRNSEAISQSADDAWFSQQYLESARNQQLENLLWAHSPTSTPRPPIELQSTALLCYSFMYIFAGAKKHPSSSNIFHWRPTSAFEISREFTLFSLFPMLHASSWNYPLTFESSLSLKVAISPGTANVHHWFCDRAASTVRLLQRVTVSSIQSLSS